MRLVKHNQFQNLERNIPFSYIVGFPNYVVTKTGHVYNHRIGRYLKPYPTTNTQYLAVTLWKDKKPKRIHIHKLVALHFIPNYDLLPCINHKDGNRQNNNVGNLEWCTYSYNVKDGFNRGRVVWNKGKKVK